MKDINFDKLVFLKFVAFSLNLSKIPDSCKIKSKLIAIFKSERACYTQPEGEILWKSNLENLIVKSERVDGARAGQLS